MGAWMCVNAEPSLEGTVWLTDGGRFSVLPDRKVEAGRAHELAGERLFVSHWATCRWADRHRSNPKQMRLEVEG